jgi:hypothetical protein
MDSDNAHGSTQNAENGLSFDFLEKYHKDGDEFLSHIVTGDDTWISFVNVETKEQWMHTYTFTKHAKKV